MAFSGPSGQYSSLSLGDVPYNQKWELLKPHIHRLYIEENQPLVEVVSIMKREFNFTANESSYKYYINKKWRMKKSIPAAKKSAMCDILQTRAQMGKPTVMTFKDKRVDFKKLRRVLKEHARQQIIMQPATSSRDAGASNSPHTNAPFGNTIFLSWNMPYGAMRRSGRTAFGVLSPQGMAVSTPSDVVVATPSSISNPSPHAATSPTSVALRHKAAVDRAHLLVQGRHSELLKSMNQVERRDMSTWLYQFWLFSFRTAKNWGRGPRNWTADLLGFNDMQDTISISSPNSPGSLTERPDNSKSSNRHRTTASAIGVFPQPSPLCRWTIHVVPIIYQGIPEPIREGDCDPRDEATWQPWNDGLQTPSFAETLSNGLESSDFSSLKATDLPIAVPQVVKAAKKSPEELLLEAFGFSIIGRNLELTEELMEEVQDSMFELQSLYPFHLATSYLDGSRICCNAVSFLITRTPLRQSYTNSLGHTVLDNLMIAILKAHTSCTPGEVDEAWQKEKRFVGEEVDICGRYDADSDCVQSLLKRGEAAIPFEWKHNFCHTSAQTICHCINAIFVSESAPDINTASGLFIKRCSHCGLKLQLYPLHCLVLTALALAQQGSIGEDLFGVLACVLCLLWHGANPLLSASISLAAFSLDRNVDECSHEELYAFDLAERLMLLFQDAWTVEIRTGWQLFCFLLRSSHEEWNTARRTASDQGNSPEDMDMDSKSDYHGSNYDDDEIGLPSGKHDNHCHFWYSKNFFGKNFFGKNKDLGTFHAAVQTEMLTYRRLADGDSWTSNNFNMQEILWSLTTEEVPRIGLLQQGLMKQYCQCGIFLEDFCLCVRTDEACTSYFMNLEDWSRTKFIEMPSRDPEWYG